MVGICLIIGGFGMLLFGLRLIFAPAPRWVERLLWCNKDWQISIMSTGGVVAIVGLTMMIFGVGLSLIK
jgi:hypothetical protein